MRSTSRFFPGTALTLALVGLLAACSAPSLPGLVGDPQRSPATGTDSPLRGASEGVVVEYVVRCSECSAQFTTPRGMESESGIEGRFRRQVRFAGGETRSAVTLIVTPPEDVAIRGAWIRVGSEIRAESGPEQLGVPVNLATPLR